jgi:pimeloyl-ACP methyl ester carboxylesterase
MRVHFVHGILDPVGTAGLLKLVPFFQQAGFDCRVPDYGLITAVETRIANPIIVRTLKPYIGPDDIYIGHSNGCAIAYDLIRGERVKVAGLVLINAALKRDIELPEPTWADVYHNAGDEATVAAVAAARLGLADSVWGDMGHSGYEGTNARITNIDCGRSALAYAAGVTALPPVSGHSDLFTAGKIEAWGPYILQRVLSWLKTT